MESFNKTTGYHRHLRFLKFVNEAFKKMKTIFSRKKHSFFIIVSIFFQRSKFNDFLPKKSHK